MKTIKINSAIATKLLIGGLVLTNIASLGYVIRDTAFSSTNLYPLIDPSRSRTNQKHFFSTINPLRTQLRQIVDINGEEGRRIGLYFEYLNTGANISLNQEERFWPASLSKMPTALAVMKKVQDGDWKLTNELVLFDEDKNDGYGELYKQPTGTKFTIEALLKEMLLESDDTAHRIFIRNLGNQSYTEVLEALGMEELFDQKLQITAKEYSRIFKALYSSSFLKREYSQLLLDWLSKTKFNTFLDAGLPDDVVFSHKIGEDYQEIVFLDSGIVYVPNRPYLLTVMVEVKQGESIDKARDIMKQISKVSYEYVANN